ncbi:uncharacterized protein LOC143565921 [Bidens hawaiensis]|uniref:uncharacterized protein LOC143565921 n=1 Tax=Bidens hawaiensis TaxID=980011 RepID=UPI00404B826F
MPPKSKHLSGCQKRKKRKIKEELRNTQIKKNAKIHTFFKKQPQSSNVKEKDVHVDEDHEDLHFGEDGYGNVEGHEANFNMNGDAHDHVNGNTNVNEDDVDTGVDEDEFDANLDDDDVNVNPKIDIFDPTTWDGLNTNLVNVLVKKGPKRDLTIKKGPADKFGRRFSSSLYTRTLSNRETCDRTWLVYSKVVNKLFFFCCKLFRQGPPKGSLNGDGYGDWKHASDRLKDHELSFEHIRNMQRLFEVRQRLNCNQTTDKVAHDQFNKERDYWKKVIFRIIALVKFLAKNGLAFRGTNEKLYQKCNGNFLGLIEMLEEFDPIIKEHVCEFKRQTVTIEESFLVFLIANDTTGKGLFDVMREELKSLGLDIDDMRGQGYDNGANMKRKHQGVQRRFLDMNPRVFIPHVPLSATRWESRVKSVKHIRSQLSDVREALLEVRDTEGGDPKTTSDANSLTRNEFSDFEFIVSVIILYEVLANVNVVSQKLQSKDMIIDDAIDKVKKLINYFKKYREVGLSNAINEAKEIVIELNLRELGEKDLKSRCYCLQDALKNGEESDIDAEELYRELKLFETFLPGDATSPLDVLNNLKQMDSYPNSLVAYRVLLTIPVTVASAERSFSKLKLLKTYLRSSMSQERLNGLTIIATENDVLETIDYKDLIKGFASKNPKRASCFV